MVGADISIAVRRRATAPALGCSHSLERQERSRHRRCRAPQIFKQLLDVFEAGNTLSQLSSCLAFTVRISRHDLGLKLSLGRDVRQHVHVVQTDWTDEPYDLRRLGARDVLLRSAASLFWSFCLGDQI